MKPSDRPRREALLAAAALFGILAVVYPNVIFGGASLVYSDNHNPLDDPFVPRADGPGLLTAEDWRGRNLRTSTNWMDTGGTIWQWEPAGVLGLAAVGAMQLAVIVGDFSPKPPSVVTATFLDVGQGDSALIEFPDGRRMLIDGGGVAAGRFLGLQDESTFSIGEDIVSTYLFSRGIRRLDTVVLTHAHHDHLDGLFDVMANFSVGELWLGRNPMIPAYRALIESAQAQSIPLRFVVAGEQIGEFTVLHPPPHWRTRKAAENNDSVVLLLQTQHQTALFTGDLELALPVVEFVNLLKVSHHGSRGVRMRVKSDVRVISVGASNPFGHPHTSTLPALRTDQLGAIEVKLEGERPVVRVP